MGGSGCEQVPQTCSGARYPSIGGQMNRVQTSMTGPGVGRVPCLRRPSRATAARLATLGAIFTLSSCMVGPDFVKPEAKANAEWSLQHNAVVTTETADHRAWW